jgi:Flp pilus assembly protein TadG
MTIRHPTSQRGIVAVEFALVSIMLFTLLIGIMEMGRMLFYWNSATEATRLGARVAVVCDVNDAGIRNKMTAMFPAIAAADIRVAYLPDACDATNCTHVTVSIAQNGPLQTAIPFVPLQLTMPSSSTTLPRESLRSSIAGAVNPACG